MRDCFIFDLDGTLLDTLGDLTDSTNEVLRRCGYPECTEEQILGYVGDGARRLIFLAVPDGTPAEDAEAALALWKELYPGQGYPRTQPYAGIPQALRDLHAAGVKLGVLSNKFDGAAKSNIARFLPGAFDTVYGERAGIPRKPDPTSLLMTIEELGSEPGRTVYVGDSPVDMQTARNAGVFALGVSWGFNSPESLVAAGADAIARTPSELLEYR